MKINIPNRVKRTYTQKIYALPEKVFPLLCPVREADWVEGWDPEIVFTNSGFAEEDCIFITNTHGADSTWIINRHEPQNYYVEMIKFTPGLLVTKLEIQLSKNEHHTDAEITYTYTALGKEGEKELEKFTEEYYNHFMKEWENEMNHYLISGGSQKT